MRKPETLDIGGMPVIRHPASGPERIRLLCFHGGGGVGGQPEMIAPFCALLGEIPGLACHVPRYRTLSRDGSGIAALVEDATQALTWARATLPEGAELYLLGASSGGFMALDAVLRDPAEVAGLVLLNPVIDTGPEGFANRVFQGAEAEALSPLTRIDGHPLTRQSRCLILQGGRDDVVPAAMARRFATLWPADRCRLVEYPQATHGFFNRAPHDGPTAAQVRDFVAGLKAAGTAPASGRASDPAISASGVFPDGATMVYCIGAQKAGTSWLHDYLGQSLDCHMPAHKELHYFDVLHGERSHLRDRLKQLENKAGRIASGQTGADVRRLADIAELCRILQIYAGRPGEHRAYIDYLLRSYTGQRLICDITPSYATLPAAAFRDMDGIGPAKFLFLMRDPVDRLWSQVRMMEAAQPGQRSQEEFEADCIGRLRRMLDGGQIASLPRVDYVRTLGALEAAVPAGRIHYAFHEDPIGQDMADGICDFLGIGRMPIKADLRVSPGRAVGLPPELATEALRALAPQYDAIRARFGARVPASWRRPEPQLPLLRRVLRPAPTKTTIVFLHIPKTAGQTVLSEIRRVARRRRISPVRVHTEVAPDTNLPPGYDVHSGHIDWVDLDRLPEDRFAFTILREPRERIASFYFYLLREAGKLSAEELETTARTGMRMVARQSASEYFFGGNQQWQRFIRDHYDNFYCTYLATRRMRGSKLIETLSQDEVLQQACAGASALNAVYRVEDLTPLERDLEALLGAPVRLSGNYLNSGADRSASRWQQLSGLLDGSEDIRRLEGFARRDDLLMRRLGLAPQD